MAEPQATLYQVADGEIRSCIEVYLELMRVTKGLSDVEAKHLADSRARIILLAGLGVPQPAFARLPADLKETSLNHLRPAARACGRGRQKSSLERLLLCFERRYFLALVRA